MSSCKDRLSHIINLAKSKKVTDYKKGIKFLLEFWEDDSKYAIEQITEYSQDPSSGDYHTWTEIFNVVHNLFMTEIDRVSKLSGNSGSLDKDRIIKLVYATSERAKYSLLPHDVVIATQQVLEIDVSHIYSQHYGMYLGILKKYVLQERSQRILVRHSSWSGILNACVLLLKNVIPDVNYVQVLEFIELIIQHGSSLSNLLYETKKLLPVIGKILENFETYHIKSTDILFKLTYTLCHQIVVDSRFSICRFAEDIPLSLINVKGPEEKYKLYLLFIQVHHPNGAIVDDDDYYAFDTDKWKAILALLFKMILNDIKPVKLSKSFIDLSREVLKQQICNNLPCMSQASSYHNSLYIQPTKKRRIDEQDKIINLVNDRDPLRAWPMIQISTALYKKYPDCLKLDEYIEFLDIVIKLMNLACKNFSIMENLCELATVLIQNDKNYEKDLQTYWDKLWDALLQYLSMSHNDVVKKGCILAQNFILHKKVSNPNSFLKLYLKNSIQWSSFSIKTLRVFCENFVLPSDIENHEGTLSQTKRSTLKLELLQITLNSITKRTSNFARLEEISKILIGFTLKSWYKTEDSAFESKGYSCINLDNNFYDNLKPITTENIETCYLSLKLKVDFVYNENQTRDIKIIEKDDKVNNPSATDDLDFLINSLIQMMQTNNGDNDLCLFIHKTSLIAQIITDIKAMNMMQCSFDEFCLVDELKTCLKKIFNQILKIDWSKSLRNSLEVTRAVISLFQAKYDKLVNELILSLIDFPLLVKIYEASKLENNEFVEDSKLYGCKINAITVLALYCSINTGSEISDMQFKIASTILKVEKYSLSSKADVVCITTLCDIFSDFPNSVITKDFTITLIDFITDLFSLWQRDDRFVCCFLKYLPKFLDIIMDDKDQVHNILLIFKFFHKKFVKGYFGQLSHLTFVQSLNSIVQHKIFSNIEIEDLNHELFIDFIKSPYYFVRLESLKYLYSMFSLKHICCKWKSDFFYKLKDAVYGIFLMQNQLSEDELQEERLLRSISAVQILSTVVCSKSIYQSPALLLLLQIYIDKGIEDNMIKKVLQVINKTNSSESIIEENFNYLLTNWCKNTDFNTFPFALLDGKDEADFCSRYLKYIFPALIREGKMEDAKKFCNRFEVSFIKAFENNFSSIIPWVFVENDGLLKQLQEKKGIFLGISNLTTLVKENLQQIVIQSVQRLHDLNDFYKIFKTTIDLPASDPPHYKIDQVEQCFVRLTNLFNTGESRQTIFYFIMTRKPSIVQKILLQLVRNIYASSLSEYKAKALHQYVYLCMKIVQELRENYCDPTVTYFVRDIGCTLLNLVKLNDEFITKLACQYLHKMLKDLLPLRSKQIGNILNLCVKTLVPLIDDKNENPIAKDILVLLLKENREVLSEAIKTLGSLPSFVKSKDDLDTESELLRDNIDHFLKTSDDKNCSIDNLSNLKRQLSTKRSQLEKMYEKLETLQGFAEHCASSLLHQLIYRLIRLTESNDTKIAVDAAKCLGVLGPADLTTMILHPQESQTREILDKADILTRKVCEMLVEFVVSSDIEVRAVSSIALYVVLKSPWGFRLVADMEFEGTGPSDLLFKDFFYPFRPSQKSTASSAPASFKADIVEFERTFDTENYLWSESSNGSYDVWVASITSSVANCFIGFYSDSLIPLFHLNTQFCEAILPRLISLLIDSYPNLSSKICHCVNRLFNYHFKVDSVDETLLNVPQTRLNESRDAIRCMLYVVNHLRVQSSEQVDLNFDYLPIAMAAQFSSAYFSSVLYAELWCRSHLKVARDFDSITIIDQVYEQDNKLGKIAQDILREAYLKIGDSDSIYGCGSSHLQNLRSRISYYSNFQKLDKVILSHDIEFSNGNPLFRGIIGSLRESSLYYLAKQMSISLPMEVDNMDDLCYDTLWRLSDWNHISSLRKPQSSKKNHDYSVYHYEALKSLHENDKNLLENCLEGAYSCVIKELSNISLESCKAVYPKLSQLQMLRELQEFSNTNPDDLENLLNYWKKQKYIYNNNFQCAEPVLTQRATMLEMLKFSSDEPVVKNALINTKLDIARLAQQEGCFNVAARALESLLKRTDLDKEDENRLLYHEARLAWIRKDEELARFNIRSLINNDSVKKSLLAHSLHVYGNWIAEKKSENPQAILNNYYNQANNIYNELLSNNSLDELNDACKARTATAQFAHEQYIMITEYLQSAQYESLVECIDYSNTIANKNKNTTDREVEKAVKISKRQTQNDCNEVKNIQKDRNWYLMLSISNYLYVLRESDDHNLLIFRLVSLWLDNMYNNDLNEIFDQHLIQIPSYKFIPLIPQLAPHMSNVLDVFSQKIFSVLERCAKEHSHHTLPVLLALKNLYNDSKYCEKKITPLEPRVLGAQQLIQKLVSTNVRPIIQEMDKLSEALVQLAYFDLDKKKAMIANCPIPKRLIIQEIKNFQYSAVLTVPLDIKKNGNYSNIISVSKYEENYSNVGGINAPKKIICVGTDGIKRPQLVKGKDDLRQDAVMQQVFTVMNSLLKTNKDAKHRKLHVRTYKVVPLTQRSGVLQWCENTLPLSNILTGDGSSRQLGLHRKYYPNDYAPTDCRKRLMGVRDKNLRKSIFQDCCKNLRPAFHHFFTENYLSPETWFERRLAYTRSVATTSIIGYILGLGDRHVSNILIDKTTAEVIHIDFGIAFEQGKVLPTPETVPFRLTRDVEVAMGVSGIEGTMRRCCEETMTVLRNQREIIATLLRVLLYDPLYSWAITPAKAVTFQSENSSRMSESKESNSPGNIETNKLAERALLRIQQKLQGIEEGVVSSVSGQVERLIQQARDPENLCLLFEGWQAYL